MAPPRKTDASQEGKVNILSFFKPVSQQPSKASQPLPSTQTPPQISQPRSPSPQLPSSPPVQKTPSTPRHHKLEIGASDDEDGSGSDGGFSDDSLEDLSAILGRARPTVVATPSRNPYATPRSKRTAVEFYSSPLTLIPKHKFDLAALTSDARQDEATLASSLKVKAMTESARKGHGISKAGLLEATGLTDAVNEKGGHDAHKVLRAVQRAEPGQSHTRYCFFDEAYKSPNPMPAPKLDNKSPWRLLTRATVAAREQHLVSGLPQTILSMSGSMPDTLFEWILDELCIQNSSLMRQEYCSLVRNCPDQVERLLSPQKLEELLIRLGAKQELKDWSSELNVQKISSDPYEARDWSCLVSFLNLVGEVARHLSIASVIYAAQACLKLSMDRLSLYNIDILTAYEGAIRRLTEIIPSSSWNSFCFETCSLLHANIKAQFIRANSLLCLPVCDERTHDLRRRLAITFLYDDPELSRNPPEHVVTIRGIINCLGNEVFLIRPTTDFAELRSTMILLDIAVDDGSVNAFDSKDDETRFNDDVDELATKLRGIWRKINDSGMKIVRTEAKSVVEWVQQRLSNSVRTRRPAKKSVFDLGGPGADDPFLPKQQDYMKKFFKKIPNSGINQ